MNTSNEFIQKLIDNNVVFTKDDLINLVKICKQPKKLDFEIKFSNLNDKNYKISKNFFGKEYYHPKNINPYRTNYNISSLINELKLYNHKISDNEKLDKIINYIKFLN